MHLFAAVSPWEFGWEALVAITTGALALFTFALACSTARVSRATRDEVQAQRRPVLLPVELAEDVCLAFNGSLVVVAVKNVGKGPAFDVRARLDPPELLPETWSHGIVHEGEEVQLAFRDVEEAHLARYELLIDYRDLADREASSRIVVQLVATQISGNEFVPRYAFVEAKTELKHIGV